MAVRAVWGAFINSHHNDGFVSRVASSQDQYHIPGFHGLTHFDNKQLVLFFVLNFEMLVSKKHKIADCQDLNVKLDPCNLTTSYFSAFCFKFEIFY